jgi:hypothetical protein
MSQSCKTCRFAHFPNRTPAGRLRHAAGKCQWAEPAVVVPVVVRVSFHRVAVWPDDGAECPTYEPIKTES